MLKSSTVSGREMSENVLISDIVIDPRLQLRASGTNADLVAEFVEDINGGDEFPAVTVFRDGDSRLWLADGFHTVEAHRQVGKESVCAVVKSGGFLQALEFAAGANRKNGARRTAADKRKAIRALLENGWATASSRSIASIVKCCSKTVEDERSQLRNSTVDDTERTGSDGKTRRKKAKEDPLPETPGDEQAPSGNSNHEDAAPERPAEKAPEPAQVVEAPTESPKATHDIQQEAKELAGKLIAIVGCARAMIILRSQVLTELADKQVAYNLIVQAPIEVVGEEIFAETAATLCREHLLERSSIPTAQNPPGYTVATAVVTPEANDGLVDSAMRSMRPLDLMKKTCLVIGGVRKALDQIELITPNDKRKDLGKDFKARGERLAGSKSPAPKVIPADFDHEAFEQFWKAYPRKTAKDKARFAWLAACKIVDHGTMLQAAKVYAKYV